MQINRSGASANHGTSTIILDKPTVRWDKVSKKVKIYKRSVRDFSTSSSHNYVIELEFSELNMIIKALGTQGLDESSETVVGELEPSLRSMLTISNAMTQPPHRKEVEPDAKR